MAGRHTPVAHVAYDIAPIVLGLLLLGYVIDIALLSRGIQGAGSIYEGLVVASLFLVVVFTGLLIQAWVARRPLLQTWLLLLVATLVITAVGLGAHQSVGAPTPGPGGTVVMSLLSYWLA